MAYRKIDPRFWDDERMASQSHEAKLLFLYLLTGPHTNTLPGIYVVGVGAIADGLRMTAEHVEALLQTLEGLGRVERDKATRVIRIPNAPRYNHAENARVVRSWWKQWQSLPECRSKHAHMWSLLEGIPADGHERAAQSIAVWNETFAARWETVRSLYRDDTGILPVTVPGSVANSSLAIALVISSGSQSDCPVLGADGDEVAQWLATWEIEGDRSEIDHFLDHHRAKGNRFKNWKAAWGTWTRNSVKWSKGSQPPPSSPPAPPGGKPAGTLVQGGPRPRNA